MDKEELLKEKDYLEKVKKVLSLLIEESKKSIDYSRDNITEMKKFMWDNLSDFTDEERALAMYEVDKDVNITNKSIDRVSKLEKSVNNPYFGKVTFHNSEFDENEQVYIGMSSVQDDLDFYVFDWRAPISSLFYNFELGKAFYEAPIGKIDGEIISKLQFKIENGKMIRCFNSDINIDDDYLQEILANSSTDRMKNIVSTIQREQNEIIRNDNDKYLIVQGVAGSGKTSVALHRIAYLLYKDKNLSSRNVLIFSPTDVFSDYISNVLPELGEDNVLELFGCYTREQQLAIFGKRTARKAGAIPQSGVYSIDNINTELLWVTLNKSDKDFSPSTQYEDYAINETLFNWQSQNSASHQNSGRRYVEQKKNGRKFILFVREHKVDEYGFTSPYYCLGLVDYVKSHGNKPMTITWAMRNHIPGFILEKAQKMAVG